MAESTAPPVRDNRSLAERMGLPDPNKRILPANEVDAPGPVVQGANTTASPDAPAPTVDNKPTDPPSATGHTTNVIQVPGDGESLYYLESVTPGLGGFFGQTQRRFKFQGNYWKGNKEDQEYILKHYSKYVHEISNPAER